MAGRFLLIFIARLKQKGILKVDGRLGRKRGFVTVYSMHLSSLPVLPNPESMQSLQTMNAGTVGNAPLTRESLGTPPASMLKLLAVSWSVLLGGVVAFGAISCN